MSDAVVDCWPITLPADAPSTLREDDAAYDPVLTVTAMHLAVQTLQALTLYRVGGCPVMLRPAQHGHVDPAWSVYPVAGARFIPVLAHGRWLNVDRCGWRGDRLRLPTGVRVRRVWLDGQVLHRDTWAVDVSGGRTTLVHRGGQAWPLHQDVTAPIDTPGAFGVELTATGASPGLLGEVAAGVLTVEMAQVLTGSDSCRLPARTTSIVRNGVTAQIAPEDGPQALFPGGLTGLKVVDLFTGQWNPYRLVERPTVYSADLVQHDLQPAQPLPVRYVEDPPGSGLFTSPTLTERPSGSGLYDLADLYEDSDHPGLYVMPGIDTHAETPVGSGLYSLDTLTEDPVGSGLYTLTGLPEDQDHPGLYTIPGA